MKARVIVYVVRWLTRALNRRRREGLCNGGGLLTYDMISTQRSANGAQPLSFLPPSTSSLDCTLKAIRPLTNTESMTIHVKSRLGAEMRRFPFVLPGCRISFEDFSKCLYFIHGLDEEQQNLLSIEYLDSKDGGHLPIINDETLRVALESRPTILRIFLVRRAETRDTGYNAPKVSMRQAKKRPIISAPQDFRRVSAIVDADVLPVTLRRVQLCKYQSNLPLGFYIRDGMSFRNGFAESGIFISRLVDNGIAAQSNLLHANDEIIEVNGIDVTSKTLDQATDIMISNSKNLFLTVIPCRAVELSSPSTSFANESRRHEKGLKSYIDTPFGGTLSRSSGGSSGENERCRPPPAYVPVPGWAMLPPHAVMPPHLVPAYDYGAPPSFYHRHSTIRLSDKIRNGKQITSPEDLRHRRPFSMFVPNTQ